MNPGTPTKEEIAARWAELEANTIAIDLPHAGETFHDSTIQLCINRLEGLRVLGYYVPQCAIDRLKLELNQK